jgi:hypothetical protein
MGINTHSTQIGFFFWTKVLPLGDKIKGATTCSKDFAEKRPKVIIFQTNKS